ncbi:MAG: DHH family phosphoesterase [Patescibacteria group bacterium]|jgi:nanoRNase/pAp phosphatase (c-di-AMP/oligoRNAs hydrolase)
MLTDDQQIFEQIEKAKNILIAFGRNHNGDSISSALALYSFLKKINKTVDLASDGFEAPKHFSFLPNIGEVKNSISTEKKFIISLDTSNVPAKEISYQLKNNYLEFIVTPKESQFKPEDVTSRITGHAYDLIIVVASPDLESLGNIYQQDTQFFFNVPIINIDRHPHNEEFGQINRIKITAISTTEIIFELLKSYQEHSNNGLIDEQIATCLLAGIFSESKSFKVGSLTPNSLVIASELIKLGADRETIVRNLYQNRDLNTLKLWGRVLAKLKSDLDGKLIWSCLNKVDFEKTGSSADGLEDVVEELVINVPEAEIIILFVNGHNDKTEIKLFSTKNINALSLLQDFNPDGSKNIATAAMNKQLTEVEEQIIKHVKNKLEKLPL